MSRGNRTNHGKREAVPALKESEIVRQILDWLTLKRTFHWRNNTGASRYESAGKSRFVRYGTAGAPDIFAVVGGMIIGIEVKTRYGVQSQAQKEFEVELVKAGGRYFVCRSLQDAIDALR